MDKDIVISIKTIFVLILFGLGIFLVYRLGSIIGLLSLALLITISLENTIQFFMKQYIFNKTMSRSLAVLITYSMVIIFLLLTISLGLDPVITQSQKLLDQLLKFASSLNINTEFKISVSEVLTEIAKSSGGVINLAGSFFGNITTVFSLLILSVYLSLAWDKIRKGLADILPQKYRHDVLSTFSEAETNVGVWLRGQLFLMLLIGGLSYVVLVAADVDYPLALALLSGLLEVVPILGPTVSTIIATIVAFSSSPVKALIVLVSFFVIQQLEGNILVPKVMEKVSGFSPIIIIIALLIGSNLFGVLGAIIALPVLMISNILVKKAYYISQKKKK